MEWHNIGIKMGKLPKSPLTAWFVALRWTPRINLQSLIRSNSPGFLSQRVVKLRSLYNTLVLSYLSYCTLVWGDKNNSFIESLFILQKKLIRTCTYSLWLEHTTPLSLALSKLKIRDIYTYQLAIHMYRYHHDLLPPDLPYVTFTTQSEIHNYNTRQVSNLHIAPTNTQLAKNTIKTQGPLIWNTLNTYMKNSATLGQFKKSLKNISLTKYTSEINDNEYASLCNLTLYSGVRCYVLHP